MSPDVGDPWRVSGAAPAQPIHSSRAPWDWV